MNISLHSSPFYSFAFFVYSHPSNSPLLQLRYSRVNMKKQEPLLFHWVLFTNHALQYILNICTHLIFIQNLDRLLLEIITWWNYFLVKVLHTFSHTNICTISEWDLVSSYFVSSCLWSRRVVVWRHEQYCVFFTIFSLKTLWCNHSMISLFLVRTDYCKLVTSVFLLQLYILLCVPVP